MLCGCADISVRGQWSAHFHSVEPVFFVVFFSFSFRFFYLFLLFFQRLETSGSPNNGSVDSTNLLGSSSLLSLYIFCLRFFLTSGEDNRRAGCVLSYCKTGFCRPNNTLCRKRQTEKESYGAQRNNTVQSRIDC